MANVYKSIYKQFNGTDWDIHHFATVTSQVSSDSTVRRYVTQDQLDWLASYFDGSNDLLDGFLDAKLPVANPAFTTKISGPKAILSDGIYRATDGYDGLFFEAGKVKVKAVDTTMLEVWGDRILFNDNRLRSVGAPIENTDAATKMYVDAALSAGMHPVTYVQVVSDTAVDTANCNAIDGRTLENGDRVLLISQGSFIWNTITSNLNTITEDPGALPGNQGEYYYNTENQKLWQYNSGWNQVASNVPSDEPSYPANNSYWADLSTYDLKRASVSSSPEDNGIYTSNGSGALTKVAADSTQGAYVFVNGGNTYNDWYFYCQDNQGTWIAQGRPDTVTASGALEKVGNDIQVKNLGITNAMLAGSIDWNKLLGNAPYDNYDEAYNSWGDLTNIGTTANLATWLSNVLGAIGILRGTTHYNTNNSQTIAGVYSIAEVKNRTYQGTTDPGTSGYVTGDIYLQH